MRPSISPRRTRIAEGLAEHPVLLNALNRARGTSAFATAGAGEVLFEARAVSRTSESVVARAPAPPAAGDAAGVCDPRGGFAFVAALRAKLARRAKVSSGALVTLEVHEREAADARRQEEGVRVADATTVARRDDDTVAVGEEGEFAIPSAHHQVRVTVAIDVADRWGASEAYVDVAERVQAVVSHTMKIRLVCRSIVREIVDPAVASSHDQIEIAVVIEVGKRRSCFTPAVDR